MAPALVELSTSKERNSNSKKYIEDLHCMSHLNLELVEKIGLDSSPLYKQNKEVGEKLEKENHSIKVMSNETNKTRININENCKQETIEDDTPTLLHEKTSCNGYSEEFYTVSTAIENSFCLNKTDIERTQQPVAKYTPSSTVTKILNSKEVSIDSKFTKLNTKLNSLNYRLHKFYKNDLLSHISCFVTKSDAILQSQQKKDSSEISKLKRNYTPLKSTYDLLGNVCLTDDEDDLDSKQRVPLRGKRQKSQRPAPSPTVLNQWKQNRAKIGSQCSWLTLKMATLEEKISSLSKLHSTMKTERTVKNHTYDESFKKHITSTQHKNDFISKDLFQDVPGSESCSDRGCSRNRPFNKMQHHKYISNQQTGCSSETQLYRCRCLGGVERCRVCNRNSEFDQNTAASLVEFCDKNYHPILSQKSDVSLAFLLEDTLRRQRINTKVTITKSKNKKKRPTSLSRNASPIDNKFHDKHPSKLSKKSERSKSDEYSRKRYAASDISGKLKKFRKLSESCDSGSKPSTPTNELASPLSQSFPSGGLSGLKRKKGSASIDYDINNIVIPYSIAASTRVERIQYKEIPTPGWRTANDMLLNNGAELDEVTDDETFSERHLRCELVEHRRFTDYFQPVRRQRSARISEGPNSEPHSPYMQDDRPIVNTPVESPNPSMSLSAKLLNRLANVCRCEEDERETPWSIRLFPLCDVDGEKLVAPSAPASPVNEEAKIKYSKPSSLPPSRLPSFTTIHNNTPRNSPLPSPSPLASPPTPESNWTVKVLNEEETGDEHFSTLLPTDNDKQRKGIVLKLAKK